MFSLLALRHGLLPGSPGTAALDPAIAAAAPLDYLRGAREQRLQRVLSNSFGFGGTNCSVVLARADAA